MSRSARTRSSPTSSSTNSGPLPHEAVKRIFERIVDEMRVVQKNKMETEIPMLVVMQEGASEAADSGGDRPAGEAWLRRASLDRRDAHCARRRGSARLRAGGFRGDGGRQERASHRVAVQARQPQLPPAGTVVKIGESSRLAAIASSSWRARAAWRPKSRSTRIAEIVADAGAKVIRGGAFKPRSSPYSFQGLGEEGLELMREAADRQWSAGYQRGDGPDADSAAWRRMRTSFRSARVTCRTTTCCANWASSASRCCSSAASRRPSKSCCFRPNTFSPAEITK